MKTVVGYLYEAAGVQSFQRLQSLILTILFVLAIGYHVYREGLSFDMAILLACVAVLPKTFQKIVEMKYGQDKNEVSKSPAGP